MSCQEKLPSEECLRVPLRSAAFDAPQTRQTAKGLFIEPLLGALAAEMRDQQTDLALDRGCRNRHVDIGLSDVSNPFRNFIFENLMISERVPRQTGDLAVILVR